MCNSTILHFVVNSPLALRVDWRVMNILQEDDKIVDLITFIGDAFPRNDVLTNSCSDANTLQTDHLHVQMAHSHAAYTDFGDCDEEIETDTQSLNNSRVDLDKSAECLIMEGSKPLIKAWIKPHEGAYSHRPFDIQPRQLVSLITCM